MGNTYVFQRYELKYKLSQAQYRDLLQEIQTRLQADNYGETTIQSLYYDTDSFRIIRNSIDKPVYKEKLRARSYGLATDGQKVFLELKKKYDGVTFKRRITLQEKDIPSYTRFYQPLNCGQVEKEIAYVCKYYQSLEPKMLLLYDRTAYLDKNSDLRITFDKNVRYRTERLNLHSGLDGEQILPNGEVLMEIKTTGAFPMWLVQALNGRKIYKTSFSKYGTAYQLEKNKITKEYVI